MGGPLQVADLPIIFPGDKCCACLRLQRGYSGDGGAGDGRTEVEGMNQEDVAGAELCVWQVLNWQDGWLSHTNLGPALSLGSQHTSSVHTHHVSSKHVETDNSASRCVSKHVTSYMGYSVKPDCAPAPIQLDFGKLPSSAVEKLEGIQVCAAQSKVWHAIMNS